MKLKEVPRQAYYGFRKTSSILFVAGTKKILDYLHQLICSHIYIQASS